MVGGRDWSEGDSPGHSRVTTESRIQVGIASAELGEESLGPVPPSSSLWAPSLCISGRSQKTTFPPRGGNCCNISSLLFLPFPLPLLIFSLRHTHTPYYKQTSDMKDLLKQGFHCSLSFIDREAKTQNRSRLGKDYKLGCVVHAGARAPPDLAQLPRERGGLRDEAAGQVTTAPLARVYGVLSRGAQGQRSSLSPLLLPPSILGLSLLRPQKNPALVAPLWPLRHKRQGRAARTLARDGF